MKYKTARTRSRLNELTFVTFSVRTAAAKGVNGIGNIDILLIPCAANDCEGIDLQETKRNGTFKVVASGYRVYVGCYCSGAKDRKYQHGLWTRFYPPSVLQFRLTNPTLAL